VLTKSPQRFFKSWMVTDWIPNRVDLQTRNRNVFSGRDCEHLPKYFYRLFGLSGSGWLCDTPVTPALLRLDPIWDPLRADPAFQKLCEEKQP
jgi:hypothetical protein